MLLVMGLSPKQFYLEYWLLDRTIRIYHHSNTVQVVGVGDFCSLAKCSKKNWLNLPFRS
jgi:hypothetical protein